MPRYNFNADRVSYHEVPQSPPLTPISSRSLPLPIQEPLQSRQRELTSRRPSPSRVSGSLEVTDFQRKSKVKESNGGDTDSDYGIQIFFPGEGVMRKYIQ